jgi:hypothetical protein
MADTMLMSIFCAVLSTRSRHMVGTQKSVFGVPCPDLKQYVEPSPPMLVLLDTKVMRFYLFLFVII